MSSKKKLLKKIIKQQQEILSLIRPRIIVSLDNDVKLNRVVDKVDTHNRKYFGESFTFKLTKQDD